MIQNILVRLVLLGMLLLVDCYRKKGHHTSRVLFITFIDSFASKDRVQYCLPFSQCIRSYVVSGIELKVLELKDVNVKRTRESGKAAKIYALQSYFEKMLKASVTTKPTVNASVPVSSTSERTFDGRPILRDHDIVVFNDGFDVLSLPHPNKPSFENEFIRRFELIERAPNSVIFSAEVSLDFFLPMTTNHS